MSDDVVFRGSYRDYVMEFGEPYDPREAFELTPAGEAVAAQPDMLPAEGLPRTCQVYVVRGGLPCECGRPATGWYVSTFPAAEMRTAACADHANEGCE